MAFLGKKGRFPLGASHLWDRLRGHRQPWFVSHAYTDAASLKALRQALPQVIEPIVFPPIEVPPDKAVSDALIHAIRGCEGVVFIDQPASTQSFWVNFERRYALRTGMSVLAFAPDSGAFTRYAPGVGNTAAVLWNPAIEEDARLGLQLAQWLQQRRRVYTERLFETWYEQDTVNTATYATVDRNPQYGEDAYSLRTKVLEYDAGIVIVASRRTAAAPWPFKDVDYLAIQPQGGVASRPPFVEVVWLEPPDANDLRAPDGLDVAPDQVLFWQALLNSAERPERLVIAEGGSINWNRADDLLVRLEYAAFQRGSKDGPDRAAFLRKMAIFDAFDRRREARYGL